MTFQSPQVADPRYGSYAVAALHDTMVAVQQTDPTHILSVKNLLTELIFHTGPLRLISSSLNLLT